VRLHGSQTLYQSAYSDAELDRWAACIAAWRTGGQPADARLVSPRAPPRRRRRDVYCYFDNTDKLQAPLDAKRLIARVQADEAQRGDASSAAAPTRLARKVAHVQQAARVPIG